MNFVSTQDDQTERRQLTSDGCSKSSHVALAQLSPPHPARVLKPAQVPEARVHAEQDKTSATARVCFKVESLFIRLFPPLGVRSLATISGSLSSDTPNQSFA